MLLLQSAKVLLGEILKVVVDDSFPFLERKVAVCMEGPFGHNGPKE